MPYCRPFTLKRRNFLCFLIHIFQIGQIWTPIIFSWNMAAKVSIFDFLISALKKLTDRAKVFPKIFIGARVVSPNKRSFILATARSTNIKTFFHGPIVASLTLWIKGISQRFSEKNLFPYNFRLTLFKTSFQEWKLVHSLFLKNERIVFFERTNKNFSLKLFLRSGVFNLNNKIPNDSH